MLSEDIGNTVITKNYYPKLMLSTREDGDEQKKMEAHNSAQ